MDDEALNAAEVQEVVDNTIARIKKGVMLAGDVNLTNHFEAKAIGGIIHTRPNGVHTVHLRITWRDK